MSAYLTTKELAQLLQIKERKVYDLVSSGEIPCSRAMGKLLFPRDAVEAWLARSSSGPSVGRNQDVRPNVVVGSHDPLLDWALRESRCGLATYFDGSLDGLDRFSRNEGMGVGIHLIDPSTEAWNVPQVVASFAEQPLVLVEWAWRERGLILAAGSRRKVAGLADLKGHRLVPRQAEAGSQILLEHLMAKEGIRANISFIEPARTETDAALSVLEGRADVAFGLKALADQYRLDFVSIIQERYDLLVDRKAWFDPPWQKFVAFWRSPVFLARASALTGYDTSGLGTVQFNGA